MVHRNGKVQRITPMTAALPDIRPATVYPFEIVEVDCFGPFFITIG